MTGDPAIVNGFWKKCLENLHVCRRALREGHCNAATSRYYYALRLAAQALFENRETILTEENGRVTHDTLILDIGRELNNSSYPGLEVRRWFRQAHRLRIKADYKTAPVTSDRLKSLRRSSKRIFVEIKNDIR